VPLGRNRILLPEWTDWVDVRLHGTTTLDCSVLILVKRSAANEQDTSTKEKPLGNCHLRGTPSEFPAAPKTHSSWCCTTCGTVYAPRQVEHMPGDCDWHIVVWLRTIEECLKSFFDVHHIRQSSYVFLKP